MNILWRRNYKYILFFVLLLVIIIACGDTRLIAYNFGDGSDLVLNSTNYENDTYIFDDSVVHEVKIEMEDGDYDSMIETYQETGEKEYSKADVTIDGVLIEDVGIRLKGNLTLRQTVGGGGNNQDMGHGGNMDNNERQMPPNFNEDREDFMNRFGNINELASSTRNFPGNFEGGELVTSTNGFPGNFGGMGSGSGNPPFLLKFDEFVDGQTYQGYAEIAIRIGSDNALLNEQVAYFAHSSVGQVVPETSYAVVETADNEPSLYVLCEHLDEYYVDKNFPNSDGILYKSGNFVGFEYLGDDPTLYSEKYEQKTNVNDDDLNQLIEFLEFVSESDDNEFEENLSDWIDLDSFINMMALDNLLGNNDSFVGMGSNYYLLFNKNTDKFTMLSWDLNLAMGGMGGGRGGNFDNEDMNEERREAMEDWMKEGGFEFDSEKEGVQREKNGNQNGMLGGRNGTNTLKDRFFENENFVQMYVDKYNELKKIIYDDGLVLDKTNELIKVFSDYNIENEILDQSEYDSDAESLKQYINQQTNNSSVTTSSVMNSF